MTTLRFWASIDLGLITTSLFEIRLFVLQGARLVFTQSLVQFGLLHHCHVWCRSQTFEKGPLGSQIIARLLIGLACKVYRTCWLWIDDKRTFSCLVCWAMSRSSALKILVLLKYSCGASSLSQRIGLRLMIIHVSHHAALAFKLKLLKFAQMLLFIFELFQFFTQHRKGIIDQVASLLWLELIFRFKFLNQIVLLLCMISNCTSFALSSRICDFDLV